MENRARTKRKSETSKAVDDTNEEVKEQGTPFDEASTVGKEKTDIDWEKEYKALKKRMFSEVFKASATEAGLLSIESALQEKVTIFNYRRKIRFIRRMLKLSKIFK